jgi:predicted dehydrogenase
VQAAAEAGVRVLVEKPLGVTPYQAQSLLALSDEVPISVAFPVRYHPAAMQLRRVARDGELGEVLAVWATNRNRFPGGWFADPSLAGGGCLLDHVVHVADLVRWVWATECVSVRAEAGVLHHPGLFAEDTAVVLAEWTNGMVMSIDPSMSRPDGMPGALDLTLLVWGERAVATIDVFADRLDSFDRDGHLRNDLIGYDMDGSMLADWVKSVREDLPPPVPASDGYAAVSLAFAAQEAVARHAAVQVNAGASS